MSFLRKLVLAKIKANLSRRKQSKSTPFLIHRPHTAFRSTANSCLKDAASSYGSESPGGLAQPANPRHFLLFPSTPPALHPEKYPIASEQIVQPFVYFSYGECPSLNCVCQENPSYPARSSSNTCSSMKLSPSEFTDPSGDTLMILAQCLCCGH